MKKIQDTCKLKEISEKTSIVCAIEKKCRPEVAIYDDGRIVVKSPKTKNPITRFLKNNINNKYC